MNSGAGRDSDDGAPNGGDTVANNTVGPNQQSETKDDVERTDSRTLEMLICPVSKSTLEYDSVAQELISRRANLAYPIRCGVPLLTREAARSLDG